MNIHELATEIKDLLPGTEVVVVTKDKKRGFAEYRNIDVQVVLVNGTPRYRFEIMVSK